MDGRNKFKNSMAVIFVRKSTGAVLSLMRQSQLQDSKNKIN